MHAIARTMCPAALITAVLTSGPRTLAQDATADATGERLQAKITAVKGVVQVRATEDAKWESAAVGMTLNEGGEFRTGPRSAVQFVIPPDQTITLDRLGTIKVLQAVKDAGKVTTALGMKYGRTRYDVQAADLEHDSTIRSPGSTLAIRGTDVTFEDMAPFAPAAVSREGRAMFRTNKRQFVSFGGAARTQVSADRGSPAETALVETRTDPQSTFSGRSETEQNLVMQLPSQGGSDLADSGVQGFREQARQEAVIIPPPPVVIIPLDLVIELKWTGAPGGNISIRAMREGEVVSVNSGVSPTGGRHLGDGVADSFGNGSESIVWAPSHPSGLYEITGFEDPPGSEPGIDRADLIVTQDPGGANIRVAEFLDIEPPDNADSLTLRFDVRNPSSPTDPDGGPPRTVTSRRARGAAQRRGR